jgi:uncharacterized OB-fold protein
MQPYAPDGRPLPLITPTSQPFFDAASRQILRMQRCPRDGFFFYPRSHCPHCLGTDWAWEDAPASGRIYSYTVDRIGQDPGQRAQLPLLIAVVDLYAGPRLVGNVIDCALESLHIGLPVTVCFEFVGNQPLLRFRPAATSDHPASPSA